ncbi:cyclic-phosphate processing receiver domain-containing protein [Arcticibacter sp. MXS-1]|uniref:cyclic-phosphate processing receiver domain-containing protein n=1 Tax=Arcticibacter sp. MXS-1 TaxID=3341726 RepID=UPI0035A9A98B
MSYKLFLDDLRTVEMVYPSPSDEDFVVVRSYSAFLNCIKERGLPAFISFDNDLGEDEEGNLLPDEYAACKWLVYESGLDLRGLRFKVHSANPVAKVQIQALLTNYVKFLEES